MKTYRFQQYLELAIETHGKARYAEYFDNEYRRVDETNSSNAEPAVRITVEIVDVLPSVSELPPDSEVIERKESFKPWRLVGAITSFTVAHSVSLAAATFDLVRVPGPPVEAVIALSIMALAAEFLRRDPARPGLTERRPWTICFPFGLLHGLGFAGALAEIGLPEADVPAALLAFNLGVEAGQLAFVAAVIAAGALLRLIAVPLVSELRRAGSNAAVATAYAVGGVSGFWFVERVASF